MIYLCSLFSLFSDITLIANIYGCVSNWLHIKDFKLDIGTSDGFVDLLDGDVDFKSIKKELAEINYDGYVTAEMIPYVPGRPEKTATAMKKIFK